jgi:hypothetical protein
MNKALTIALAVVATSLSSAALAQSAASPHQHGAAPAAATAPAQVHQQHEATPGLARAGDSAVQPQNCSCCEMMQRMMTQMQAMMASMHHGHQTDDPQGARHQEPPAAQPSHQDHQPPQPN